MKAMHSRPDIPPPGDILPDQAVWDEVECALERLTAACRTPSSPGDFYRTLLAELVPLLAADHAAVWLREASGPLRIAAQTAEWATSIDDRQAHEKLVADTIASGDVLSLPPGASRGNAVNLQPNHYIVVPVTLAHWTDNRRGTVAAIDVALPAGRAPSSYQGAQQVLEAAGDLAAEYHVRRELTRLASESGRREALTRFAEQVGGEPDLMRTAMAMANEGRRLLHCDRLSVLLATPRRARLLAVSGVDRVERRSRAAQALERLATMALQLDEPIHYTDTADGDPPAAFLPQIDEVIDKYVDEFHARQVLVMPIAAPAGGAARSATRGVLVAEQFAGAGETLDRSYVAELASVAAPAMATAIAWHELPLGSVLRWVGWLRMPRNLFRLGVVAVMLAAIAAALLTIQTPLRIDVRGELRPVNRQDVFAPRSAIVDSLATEHGDQVSSGQTLLVLRDPELAAEIERIRGEQSKVERQLDAARATRSTANASNSDPLDLYRLSGEEQQLKTELSNLAQQLQLLTQQAESLVVISPLDGMVTTWQVAERLAPGRPVERGQVLVSVANTRGDWILELSVPDERVDMLRQASQPLRVEYRLGSDSSRMHSATVTHIAHRVDVVATPSGEQQRQLRIEATPDDAIPDELRAAALRPGGSVRARIVVGDKPLAYVLTNDLWRTIRNWWEF